MGIAALDSPPCVCTANPVLQYKLSPAGIEHETCFLTDRLRYLSTRNPPPPPLHAPVPGLVPVSLLLS